MLRDFDRFEQQLRDEGFFKPSLLNDAYRLLELTALFALGLYLFSLRTTSESWRACWCTGSSLAAAAGCSTRRATAPSCATSGSARSYRR